MPKITESYSGYHDRYTVSVDGVGTVYTTKDRRDMKMFVAELKIRAMQSDKSFKAGQVDAGVIGWIEFKGNEKLFEKAAKNNCKIMFDDGSICRYNDEHPRAIMTHFKIEERQ